MTRSYNRRRITRPIRIAPPRKRDPSITPLGFTCFRLVDGETAIEVEHSKASMFAFVAVH